MSGGWDQHVPTIAISNVTVLDDKTIQGDVTLPDGRTIPILDIHLDLEALVESMVNYVEDKGRENQQAELPSDSL
jgi:hypothetical protein